MPTSVADLTAMSDDDLRIHLHQYSDDDLVSLVRELKYLPGTESTRRLARLIDDVPTVRHWQNPNLDLGYVGLDFHVTDPTFIHAVLQPRPGINLIYHRHSQCPPKVDDKLFPILVDVAALLLCAWSDRCSYKNDDDSSQYMSVAAKMFAIFDLLVTKRAFFSTTLSLQKAANRVFRLIPADLLDDPVRGADGVEYNVSDRISEIVNGRG